MAYFHVLFSLHWEFYCVSVCLVILCDCLEEMCYLTRHGVLKFIHLMSKVKHYQYIRILGLSRLQILWHDKADSIGNMWNVDFKVNWKEIKWQFMPPIKEATVKSHTVYPVFWCVLTNAWWSASTQLLKYNIKVLEYYNFKPLYSSIPLQA